MEELKVDDMMLLTVSVDVDPYEEGEGEEGEGRNARGTQFDEFE